MSPEFNSSEPVRTVRLGQYGWKLSAPVTGSPEPEKTLSPEMAEEYLDGIEKVQKFDEELALRRPRPGESGGLAGDREPRNPGPKAPMASAIAVAAEREN